jgi:hypothetical protein
MRRQVEALRMFNLGIWPLIGIVVLVLIIWAFIVVFGRIVNRAGYSRWWLLTMAVPLLNLVMLWIFAFADWPAADAKGQALA